MNADAFSRTLKAEYPVPEDMFARAFWMGEASAACSLLSSWYAQEEKTLILKIQEDGAASDVYSVVEQCRPYASVNTRLLKERERELYEDIVHIRASDAVKILGRRRVYELAAEAAGDAIAGYELVTVTDVKHHLPAAEAAQYLVDGSVFVKYSVVRKEE